VITGEVAAFADCKASPGSGSSVSRPHFAIDLGMLRAPNACAAR
jgi:hypothetical protein